MSLLDQVRVNTHYTRSINLERDASSTAVVDAYVPTSRALKTLQRVHESLVVDQAPRAWSLVGPYGSGKSSFAVFLAHLLEAPETPTAQAALKVLKRSAPELADEFDRLGTNTQGHCVILLTGSPESLASALMHSAADAAARYWGNRRGRAPAIVAKLRKLADRGGETATEVVDAIADLQAAVVKAGGNGVLVVIDELGKFLEYEARHYGANDIYLLQSLAEHAYASHAARLSVVVLLHQSFEQYAKGLGEALKNEWAKVQGRYENIPFLESTEQVLRIVAAAFEQDISQADQQKVLKLTQRAAAALAKAGALPGALNAEEASALFARCYPLHPITALLLPMLCQKVAQNERTLFSYLGSQESHGLHDGLRRCEKIGDWIYPWEVYEYFIRNQPAALADPMTHRRWAEVVTAVERLGDAEDGQAQLLKAIGLLNIVGAQGGFKATKEVAELCLPTKQAARQAAAALIDKSIVQFRKFSGEYRVWQGSDFDIDAAVDEELSKLGQFGLAAHLTSRQALLPIVARKYTIQTGALRYFLPRFVDAQTYEKEPVQGEQPRVIFFLSEGQDDQQLFVDEVAAHFSDLDIVVEYLNSPQLRQGLAEVLALEAVQHSSQELHSDPVAKREFNDRYQAALQGEQALLDGLLDQPASSAWYWRGRRLAVHNKRALQHAMSEVLEGVYCASPIVPNELINRDNPSSQAVAARNKLLFALLNHVDREDLGIEKFPAEKGIYRALLKSSRLHRKVQGKWALCAPDPKHDPNNFSPVWGRIEQFFAESEDAPLSFDALYEVLSEPPYGVKRGVLPILCLVAYLMNEHELALYEEGVYSPTLTEEQIERFGRHPRTFSIQRFRIDGMRASIFGQYSEVLYGVPTEKSVIELARPLAKFMGQLEDYTKRTKSPALTERAKAVRTAFNLAKSPQRLLFEGLPAALGYSSETIKAAGDDAVEGFAQALTEALRELKHCYPEMLDEQRRLLAQAFHLDPDTPLADLRRTVLGRYAGLESYTVDVDGLKAFIKRLTKPEGDEAHWFENVLMFLGQRPSKKWSDADRAEAEIKLSDYSKRMLDLETLRLHYERHAAKTDGDFDVILLKSMKKGEAPIDEVVAIDEARRGVLRDIKAELSKVLDSYKDPELRLAAIAEFVDEFLHARRASHSKNNEKTAARPKEVKNA
jgi:hypothetical protein